MNLIRVVLHWFSPTLIGLFWASQLLSQPSDFGPITLVVHGGAGTIERGSMTPELEEEYRSKISEALNEGYEMLSRGGTSLEAIVGAITILEDSPLFNAGRGAVFTSDKTNELDASIMTGHDLNAGAIAGVSTIKNPILAAREVMTHSPHVMLSGKGAESFARDRGLETVEPSYFYTQKRYDQLLKIQSQENAEGRNRQQKSGKYGTVGAVALDQYGNLAAGTSTGGMTNKRYGRIGDSPIIAAGTYADNNSCGVSSTGHGEFFIRSVAAYDVAARMKYKRISVQKAAIEVIKQIEQLGGTGGMIALDRKGQVAMPFNTPGMYRGYISTKNDPQVFIYR